MGKRRSIGVPFNQQSIRQHFELAGEQVQQFHSAITQLRTPTLKERAPFILDQVDLEALAGNRNDDLLGEFVQVSLFQDGFLDFFFQLLDIFLIDGDALIRALNSGAGLVRRSSDR